MVIGPTESARWNPCSVGRIITVTSSPNATKKNGVESDLQRRYSHCEKSAIEPNPHAAKSACLQPMKYGSSVAARELRADEEKTIRTPIATRKSAGRRIH
jgi:hypothetical protein